MHLNKPDLTRPGLGPIAWSCLPVAVGPSESGDCRHWAAFVRRGFWSHSGREAGSSTEAHRLRRIAPSMTGRCQWPPWGPGEAWASARLGVCLVAWGLCWWSRARLGDARPVARTGMRSRADEPFVLSSLDGLGGRHWFAHWQAADCRAQAPLLSLNPGVMRPCDSESRPVCQVLKAACQLEPGARSSSSRRRMGQKG